MELPIGAVGHLLARDKNTADGPGVVGAGSRWAAQNGWHVLHAVPVGREGADIDHVVIASFGVVTVNTKTTKTRVGLASLA